MSEGPRKRSRTVRVSPEGDAEIDEPIPELYFATTRAIGTPLRSVIRALRLSLNEVNFHLHPIQVSDCLQETEIIQALYPEPAHEEKFDRYNRLLEAARFLRRAIGERDAVITTAISRLSMTARASAKADASKRARRGVAFLFRNVMDKREVERLRKLYDRQFFLISIFSPQEDRIHSLTGHLGEGLHHGGESRKPQAEYLVRQEAEPFTPDERYDATDVDKRKFSTDIPSTFQHGDLFLDVKDRNNSRHIRRFVDLIFGHPFHTPTIDEIGMADAFSAALESSNLARQVGAAIYSEDRALLAVGTNDVPRPGGGVYRFGDDPDYRDFNDDSLEEPEFRRGFDASDTTRRYVLQDLIHRLLADASWLRELDATITSATGKDSPGLGTGLAAFLESRLEDGGKFPHSVISLESIVAKVIQSDLIWEAQFFDALEYGRTMHAEMDAITSAARKGVSIQGATLYCTTLPCHECARLIIGAGIRRVIFIEPYEKSRITQLYDSEIRFTTLAHSRATSDPRKRVDFVPYVGVSPRRFQELFSLVPRKVDDVAGNPRTLRGRTVEWSRPDSRIRETIISYSAINSAPRLKDVLLHEKELIRDFEAALSAGADSAPHD